MTILQGTTSTGQIIPVQVDGQGRLVAQGLEGPPGPKGDCTALIGTDYVINRFAAHFTDPGSYPEYVLIGRFRPADQFRMIGTFQGARGS